MQDFIGMAREQHEATLPSSACCVHFNGAGGNVAAGKYNDVGPALATWRIDSSTDKLANTVGDPQK